MFGRSLRRADRVVALSKAVAPYDRFAGQASIGESVQVRAEARDTAQSTNALLLTSSNLAMKRSSSAVWGGGVPQLSGSGTFAPSQVYRTGSGWRDTELWSGISGFASGGAAFAGVDRALLAVDFGGTAAAVVVCSGVVFAWVSVTLA